jgi:hypothetical protein
MLAAARDVAPSDPQVLEHQSEITRFRLDLDECLGKLMQVSNKFLSIT